MRENIELSRFREFGDIISDTFILIRQNFKPLLKAYFVICGLFLVADILVSITANNRSSDYSQLASIGEFVVDGINYTTFTLITLSYLAVYKEKGNQPAEVLEVWGYFKYYFFRVLLAQVLLGIAFLIGFFLCILPGIYLMVVFSLVTPIMVMENGNLEYSFKKAFKIIKGNWWLTFGIMLIITILVFMAMLVIMVPPMLIYGGGQWLAGRELNTTAGILQSVMFNNCQVLFMVPTISITLVYYSLTEEKEGNSLVNRIKLFGKVGSGSDPNSPEQY